MEPNDAQPSTMSVAPGEKAAPVYRFDGGRFAGDVEIKAHDFRRPPVLSQAKQRRVELFNQKFGEHLGARLSTFLRMDCGTKLAKFETPTYRSFVESIESPGEIALLQIDPLPGVALLNVELPLCHSMIDRMLGGRGLVTTADRNLSEIEIALLEDVIQVIMDEWCQQWRSETKLRSHCLGHDTSARFLKTSLPDATMLVATIEIQFSEAQGQLRLGLPYSMVEPMVKETPEGEALHGAVVASKQPQWRPSYDEISVPVVAHWKVKEMRVEDLVTLSTGDVLALDPDLIARTHVQFANSREFIGSVGIQNGRVAVQLTKHLALK